MHCPECGGDVVNVSEQKDVACVHFYGLCTKCFRYFQQDQFTEGTSIYYHDRSVIQTQPLPCPDEAPLTSCPHCGEEYSVKEEEGIEDYEQVEGIPCIARHQPCGGLVRMVSWADDLRHEPCKLGLAQNDVGECWKCPHRTMDFE